VTVVEARAHDGRSTVARKLVCVNEAAMFLRVHRVTLYRMLKKGRIPGAFKIGRAWRLDLNELERLLETKGGLF
jgi:excisionase family DNA binding protein